MSVGALVDAVEPSNGLLLELSVPDRGVLKPAAPGGFSCLLAVSAVDSYTVGLEKATPFVIPYHPSSSPGTTLALKPALCETNTAAPAFSRGVCLPPSTCFLMRVSL